MEFRSEEVENFKTLFESVKFKILNREGCQHLELLHANDQTTFFTYSVWTDENALNGYRHSELFGITWKKTKALFSAPAKAWSTTQLHNLDSEPQ